MRVRSALGRTRTGVLLACAVLAGTATPSLARNDCFVAGMTAAWYHTESRTMSGLLTGGRAPDVVQDRRASAGRTIERWDGATGHRRWRTSVDWGGLTVTPTSRGDQLRLTADTDACGGVEVSSLDPKTGRATVARRLGSVATTALPDTDVYTIAPGDINGDGYLDTAVLRTVHNRPGDLPAAVWFGQPSGHATSVPVSPWRSRVDVVDGRTGKVALGLDLGSARAAFPNAVWLRRGGKDALVVVRPVDTVTAEVSMLTGSGRVWVASAPIGTSDVQVFPVTGGVAVVGLTSGEQAGYPFLGTITVLDADDGHTRWSKPLAGQLDVEASGDGHLLVSDLAAGITEKLSGATGASLWRHGPDGPLTFRPTLLTDADGHGVADIALFRANGNAVISGEDGHVLLSLGADEQPFAAGDLTGDHRTDLVVVVAPSSAAPTVRLVAGRTLKTVWTKPVAFGDHGSAVEITAGGGAGGTVLAHAISGPTCALAASNGRLLWCVAAPK